MAKDYKIKYLDIRAKFLEATDVAFRLGMEEGLKKGREDQMMQQQQEQMQQEQMAQQAAMQGGEMPVDDEGAPIEEEEMQGGMAPQSEGEPEMAPGQVSGGSELDNHIDELQSLVQKGEKPKVTDLRNIINELASVRKNQKKIWANKNKKNVSAQKSFVDNMLKKWSSETKEMSSDLEDIIKESGVEVEKD